MRLLFLAFLSGVLSLSANELRGKWEVPEVGPGNLQQWQSFIFPKGKELAWREVRWHRELEFAAVEAAELNRPVLLWTMNGHPAGET